MSKPQRHLRLVEAKKNAASSPFAERVKIMEWNFLKYSFDEQFDLIVSNPPFFKGVFSSGIEKRNRARHEFSLPQKDFIEKAVQLLTPEGKLAVILSVEEGRQLIKVDEEQSFPLQRLTKVYGSPSAVDKRWLMGFGSKPAEPEEAPLVLRDQNKLFSIEYMELTRKFYLDM